MKLKQLEYFVRVAELGSFTRAGTELGVAQPALSRQVRQLEVELRHNLLSRNGRGVTLTEAGLVLLEHGRGILHQVAVAREELGAVRGALAGRVSIGLPPSLSKLITVQLTLEFRAELPQAQLTLTEGFSVAMCESLRAGRVDMAVLYDPPRSPDLEMTVLHAESLVLIAGPRRKSAAQAVLKPAMPLAALARLPLILPSRPNAFRMLIETAMAQIDCKPDVVLEIDGLNAILELVKEGLGYAILPSYTLSSVAAPHSFSVHRIQRPRLMSQLMLVCSSRRPLTATHRQALQLTRDVVSAAVKAHTQTSAAESTPAS